MSNTEGKEKESKDNSTTVGKMRARILDTIKTEGISPKPKWHFLLKEWVIWVTAGIAFLLGAIATTLTIYMLNVNRFMEHVIEITDADFWFSVVPLLWILLVVVGIFYTVYAARESKKGYKWSLSWLVSIALFGSVVLGTSAYAVGAGDVIDGYLLTKMPLYKKMTHFEPDHWMDIDNGVVVGMVTSVLSEGCTVERMDTHTPLTILFDTETEILTPNQEILLNAPVKIIGEEVTDDTFYAKEVEPFMGRGGGMFRPPEMMQDELPGNGVMNGAMLMQSSGQGNMQNFQKRYKILMEDF